MKKLMIAAAMSQAAAIAWQSGTIYVATDAAGTTGTGTANRANTSTRLVNMYIYALTEEQFNAASAMDTATLYDTYYKTTPTASKGTGGTGVATYSQTVGDASGINYALLLFVDEINANLPDGKDAFVKATLATANVEGSSTVTMSNQIGSSLASNWTAVPVPEPTSGLLLLLGIAGMALRRRRA